MPELWFQVKRCKSPDTVGLDRLPGHFDDFMSIYSWIPAGTWFPVGLVGIIFVVGFPVFICWRVCVLYT